LRGFVLDTNIVSHGIKPKPSARLGDWTSAQPNHALFVSSLTVAEIWRGVLDMPEGRKRHQLIGWFTGPYGPPAVFAGRILPFDERAAVAEVNDCVIVTDNERDFAGLEILNPLRGEV
jgi:predicted nucleic acid-binding protein